MKLYPIIIWLVFWIVLAFVICLIPGPDVLEERLAPEAEAQAPEDGGQRTEVGGQGRADAPLSSDRRELAARERTEHKAEIPEPRTFLSALSPFLTEKVKAKERLAHFIPMIGIGFCCIRLLRGRKTNLWKSVLATLSFVALVSLSIEISQELLPEWFHRGFALDDIGVSLLGGLFGGIVATVLGCAARLSGGQQ